MTHIIGTVLEVQGLVKRYGDVVALSELTISLRAGAALVLLGRNGAGKTTALRCMAGLVRPSGGSVRVGGVDTRTDADAVRAQIGLMPEVPGLYERMSAPAYLDYFGAVYGLEEPERRARIGSLLRRFDLAAAGERWLGTFSKGMRQKVALIRATLHQPRLILADEPTSALDPDSARRAWDYLRELQAGGAALVICTHSMDEAQALAGTVGIMSAGRLLAAGDLDQLTAAAGLTARREVALWPGLRDIYLAIVGEHLDGYETRLA